MLPLHQKVKVLYLWKKKIHAEVGKISNKKEFSIREIVKKEKEIHGSFATQTAKIMAGVQGKCFVK